MNDHRQADRSGLIVRSAFPLGQLSRRRGDAPNGQSATVGYGLGHALAVMAMMGKLSKRGLDRKIRVTSMPSMAGSWY